MSSQRDKGPEAVGPVIWTEDGHPRSGIYGDVYFSAEDGLAEARAVFLQGCGLPQAWAGRERFVVGELGFGSGLNILALLDLWRKHRPTGGNLHVFSIEAHPLSGAEAARALGAWPELADLSALLTSRWPGRAHGFHRLELPELRCILDVAIMEAAEALASWSGKADAWFLDGFSPALNPAMWRAEVLKGVAARSAPGARAATFTVAGQVRRDLAAAGFTVSKQPGFGRKRERLEAVLPGPAPLATSAGRVAIVGAGIAGAAAARAVRALGGTAILIEAEQAGAGASGNPLALMTPRLDAGLQSPARLFARAFARAAQLYEQLPEAIRSRGVLQLAREERDLERFSRIAASDLFEEEELEILGAAQVEARMGEPAAPAALAIHRALTVSPPHVLKAWCGDVVEARVASLAQEGEGWLLRDADGATIVQADAVILAAGLANRDLLQDLPLAAVRGQVSSAQGPHDFQAAAWGGYVAAGDGALLFGATHDRDESVELREADHTRNLATLARALPGLAARLQGAQLDGRASVRATTPDRMPLAGPVAEDAPGLFVLGGLGSRGFTLAPLLAEHVAALALGAPSPLPASLQELVAPDRFARRAARRGRP